jgi:hypothetical protein
LILVASIEYYYCFYYYPLHRRRRCHHSPAAAFAAVLYFLDFLDGVVLVSKTLQKKQIEQLLSVDQWYYYLEKEFWTSHPDMNNSMRVGVMGHSLVYTKVYIQKTLSVQETQSLYSLFHFDLNHSNFYLVVMIAMAVSTAMRAETEQEK